VEKPSSGIKLKMIDCTWANKRAKHKVVKKRLTVYICTKKNCSWYMVPTLGPTECVMVGVEGLDRRGKPQKKETKKTG
jgi:hypothetical protein